MTILRLVDTGEDYIETSLLASDDNWVGTIDAGLVLSVSSGGWASLIGPGNDYCELRRRVRGTKGKRSARGQGWHWYVPDLLFVRRIRQSLECSTKMALRVFAAHRKGKLDFLEGIGQ